MFYQALVTKLALIFAALFGLSACLTVNKGLSPLEDADIMLAKETGSELESCLISKSILEDAYIDTDELAQIELDAQAETNSFAALGQLIMTGDSSMGLNPLFNYGYAGYSADVRGVSSLLEEDRYDAAIAYYARRSGDLITGESDSFKTARKVGVLGLVTRGAIHLDHGDIACAAVLLSAAEAIKNSEESGSLLGEFIGKATSYSLEGYERVLLLNQLALGYLLSGDPKAYAVVQRARRFQENERQLYEAELALTEAETAERKAEAEAYDDEMLETMDTEPLENARKIASRVTSPYVNPLADYLSAVMGEIEATAPAPRAGIWDETRIAWLKADKLHKNNPIILDGLAHATFETNKLDPNAPKDMEFLLSDADYSAEMVAAMQDKEMKPISRDQRIIHVIAGLGLAPERKVMMARIPINDSFIALKIPYMSERKTDLTGFRVKAGDQIHNLAMISDIEAMISRYHEDGMGLKIAGALVSGFTGYYLSEQMGGGLIGSIFNEVTQQITMPSTLGWISLPKAYHAARIILPRGIDTVTLEVLGKNGKVIDQIEQKILPHDSGLIYARSIDGRLTATSQSTRFTMNLLAAQN